MPAVSVAPLSSFNYADFVAEGLKLLVGLSPRLHVSTSATNYINNDVGSLIFIQVRKYSQLVILARSITSYMASSTSVKIIYHQTGAAKRP